MLLKLINFVIGGNKSEKLGNDKLGLERKDFFFVFFVILIISPVRLPFLSKNLPWRLKLFIVSN